jgi:phosphoribosylcarboxyaminoimidazole (NCAIR) mutase
VSRCNLLRITLMCVVVALGLIVVPLSSAAAATLSGTVTGQLPNGKIEAISGANVIVTPTGGGEALGSTSTGNEGNYALEIPNGFYDVRVEPGKGGPFEATTIHKVEVSGARGLNVFLTSAGVVHLSGTLLDAAGEPVVGAQVTANTGETPTVSTTTAADGSWALVTAPHANYEIVISGRGGAAGLPGSWFAETSRFPLEADRVVELTLPPTQTVTVEALGAEGAPLAGAAVSIPYIGGPADIDGTGGFIEARELGGKTDSSGRASFIVFRGGASFTGSSVPSITPAAGSGYGYTTFKIPTVEGDTTAVVEPPRQVHLSGTLLDAAGEPVVGAQVTANTGETPTVSTTTAADGSWALVTAPHANYEIVISGRGGAAGLPGSWFAETSRFPLEADRVVELTLPPTQTVTVEALGAEGAPLAGAAVSIPYIGGPADIDGTGGFIEARELGGKTDSSGRASFIVFRGGASFTGSSVPSITPAAGSGYGYTTFKIPTVEGDTTAVVDLAAIGGGEPEEGGPLNATELLFEPSEIDTSETKVPVSVFAHVDAEAGFASGYASFRSPSGESTIVAPLEFGGGTEFSGSYIGVATFPQGSEPGEWFAELHLSDSAGHEVALGPEQLNERGMPYEVTVLKPASPPVVTGISPNSGPESGGTAVHLVGSGFGGVTAVHFGASLAEFVYESPESITAYAPAGTGNVGVAVTTPGGISGEVNYAYTPSAAVSLGSSPNPSVHGQRVTFTSVVEPAVKGGPTPLGTVTFREGTTTLGVANLSKGKATLSTTTLGAGEHPVVAEYSGDSHYGAAASSAVTQVVAEATTEVTLTSSLNPAPFGSSGTLKAHVAAVAPGAGTPAGTITFREGETVLGTVQLSGGNASLSLKSLAPGEYAITAAYSGDANDKASEAGPVKQVVTKASTELALTTTLNPAPFGSSATLKATVKAVTPGGGTPSGTVTFREGETVLASVPLSAGSAKYALKTTAPGEHEIIATYSGEADYESSSGAIAQTIAVASTELTLTSSKNPAPHGSSGTLKATVKTIAPGGGTPAGTVTFREGEAVLAIIPLSSGSATYPLKAFSIGEHKITATYSGNADYGASESTIGQVITS